MYQGPKSLPFKTGFMTGRRVVFGVALAALLLGSAPAASAVELNVLAAGAVEAVVRDMVGNFEKQSGNTVRLAYAPVGLFAIRFTPANRRMSRSSRR